MTALATVDLFAVGAAALALWLVARFPAYGPRSLARSLVLIAASFLALDVTSSLTGPAVARLGAGSTLLLLVLPALTFAFWAWACLVRALLGLLARA